MSKSQNIYCLDSRIIDKAKSEVCSGRLASNIVYSLLRRPNGGLDGLLLALLRTYGTDSFVHETSSVLGLPHSEVKQATQNVLNRAAVRDFKLTGAEATAFILRKTGVRITFAYPGTSELALCDSFVRTQDIYLINSRGDKPCAFMAAGANLLKPGLAVAVLHGARGLTNAAGAIADTRRNEVAVVYLVGLPSTTSSRFLPPHGEIGLMEGIGHFVKWWHELEPIPSQESELVGAAESFASSLYTAVHEAVTRPYGPTMLGIPQDVAEKTWIPWSSLAAKQPIYHVTSPDKKEIHSAAELLVRHHRIIILIDDYLLTYREAKPILARFSELSHAPILQIRYRRGPMLFERLMRSEVPNFMGCLDFESCEHQSMFDAADLLVTLEDRNMYCRVVGDFPACPKIAISSDASKVIKNDYLNEGDILIEADVVAALRAICDELVQRGKTRKDSHWAHSMEVRQLAPGRRITPAVESLRTGLVKSIAQVTASLDAPVLVDDSQMFGGLISEYYDLLPAKLRIFGYHGGFVGGGISYSTGLAIGNPTEQVICALGDQGFINGLQGFIAAQQEQANVVFLVCNNGGSVSLLKQLSAASKREASQDSQSYLANTPGIEYVRIANALGIAAWVIDFPSDRGLIEIQRALSTFEGVLLEALRIDGPSLIELRLPGLGEFWTGIWRTQGYDESARRE